MIWWLIRWLVGPPPFIPLFPPKPLARGGRVAKKKQWVMVLGTRPNGEKEVMWKWHGEDDLEGLSRIYEYWPGSRKVT